MLYPFTTPKHTFVFPEDPQTYQKIRFTYEQDGKIILTKEFLPNDPNIEFGEDNTASFRLTQQETGKFTPSDDRNKHRVRIQAHLKDANDWVWASEVISVTVGEALDKKELE